MWCGVVWCGVVWCGVVWCGVVWCGVVWCGVVWCGVVWCGVVWCGVMPSSNRVPSRFCSPIRGRLPSNAPAAWAGGGPGGGGIFELPVSF